MSTTEEALVIRYLLGELPTNERGEVERRFFTEPNFLNLVRALEERLICDALAGDLEPGQLTRFQEHFLSFPDLRQKYEATKALQYALSPPGLAPTSDRAVPVTAQKRIYPRSLAIAACIAGLLIVADDVRLRFARAGGEGAVLKAAIEPGLIRSGASQQVQLRVPPRAVLVQISLKVERSDHHKDYQAILSQVDSRQEILRTNGLIARPAGNFQDVVVELPVSLLAETYYVLTLNGSGPNGSEPVETYSFEVIHSKE